MTEGTRIPLPSVDRPPQAYGKVAVLFGGQSAEREVSLAGGQAVLDALRTAGVDAHAVDPDGDVVTQLKRDGFQRAFIMLHGRGGEDGTLQGALEIAGMPYTGSGVLASALAMDKQRTKLVWRALGIPTPEFRVLWDSSDVQAAAAELSFPLMVKPANEGSSIGMSKVADAQALPAAWEQARHYGETVLAETWIEGPEYTASILNDSPLPLIRLETPRIFYDYEAKYADGAGTRYICPSELDPQQENEFQELALKAFRAVGAQGWGRVDFLCDAEQRPWFIEVNTVPGMTSHSLVPLSAGVAGLDFGQLVIHILEGSLQ